MDLGGEIVRADDRGQQLGRRIRIARLDLDWNLDLPLGRAARPVAAAARQQPAGLVERPICHRA
jgi:hypothetical protein